jgi:hypothetical protein
VEHSNGDKPEDDEPYCQIEQRDSHEIHDRGDLRDGKSLFRT